MWKVTNKVNNTEWPKKITDEEKTYWESTPYGKGLKFEEIQPAPRIATPAEVKPVAAKRKTRKRKKSTVGEKPSGDES